MFSVSSIQFPEQGYYQQAGVSFSAYANSLSVDARIALGNTFQYLGSRESNGSPQTEFVNASLQWVGQSLVNGEWASAPPNMTSQAFAAAVVEFGTDGLIGAAIGLGLAAAFWALPVAVVLPASVVGGYLAVHIGGALPGFMLVLAPLLGGYARGMIVDWLKNLAPDLHHDINDLYWQAGGVDCSARNRSAYRRPEGPTHTGSRRKWNTTYDFGKLECAFRFWR